MTAPIRTVLVLAALAPVALHAQEGAPTLEEISDEIAGTLQEEAITARLEELRAATDVTVSEDIDPALINDLSLLDR